MAVRSINSEAAPESVGGYSQAVETRGTTRRLYISGQVPLARDGTLPSSFRDQARQVWANIEAQLAAAEMTLDHLVKATIFLADRAHILENREVRREVLGGRAPALTVIIAGIFDEAWLLEIEAIAEA